VPKDTLPEAGAYSKIMKGKERGEKRSQLYYQIARGKGEKKG